MKTIFEVGDRVFHAVYEWDYIAKIVDDEDEEMSVLLKNADVYVEPKLLSFTEYTLQGFSQERPKKEPEIGSLCLFSDNKEDFNNNIGRCSILSEIGQGKFPYVSRSGNVYKFCKQIEIKEV